MTVPADLFIRFGVALAIGFMIGLQREYAFRAKQQELLAADEPGGKNTTVSEFR